MAISGLLWGFGMSLFYYIQPLYIAYLGASPEQIGLALGLSGLVVTIAYIPMGLWADRHGRKPVIVAGWALATGSMLAMALAPDWRWFTPAWAFFLLSNFAVPAYQGYIAANQQDGSLGRTFAIISSGSSLGSVISPAIGGWIGEQFGLRMVYASGAFFALLSTLVLTRLSNQPVGKRATRAGHRALLLDARFRWQITFMFLLFMVLELGQVMAPKFLQDVRGWSVGAIGLMGTVGAAGIVLITLLLGALRDRVALLGSQLFSFSALVLWALAPGPAAITIAYFLHGSHRIHRPVVSALLARRLNASTMSFGYGFQQTAMQLGWAVAPYLAGLLYARSPYWPFYGSMLGLGLTLLLTARLPAPEAELEAETAAAIGETNQ